MSSYIQGVTDYLPTLQPFKPDLNFYANVLQAKQSQYDAAHKQISQAYGTLMNSPMLRDGNIQRRDQFFKNVEQNIKKISKLDLSQEQNVNAAMQAFRPLYEDKSIMNDMVKTKTLYNEMARGENFRNCVDPDKCGGMYNPDSIKALNYWAEDFKNASDEDAMSMSVRKFAPTVQLMQNAIKAAKDAGFNISLDSKKGGYIVTDHNGSLLLNDSEGHPGVLPNYLLGLFKDDPKVMEMFETKAYTARKDFAKSNAYKYAGGESEAESDYIRSVLGNHANALLKQADDFDRVTSDLENRKAVLEEKIRNKGGVVSGSDEESALELLNQVLDSRKQSEGYYKEVRNTVETAKNIQNPLQMRSRADAIVAHGAFSNEINTAARAYALGTAKSEIKADPYDLAKYNSDLNISEKDHDLEIWKKKQEYEDAALIETANKLGIDPILLKTGSGSGKVGKIVEDIKRRGGADPSEAVNVTTTQPAGAALTKTVVDRNEEILDNANKAFVGNARTYMKSAIVAMKNQYDVLSKNTDAVSKQKASSIASQIQNLFRDSKFSGIAFLTGKLSAEDLSKVDDVSIGKIYESALGLEEDKTRYTGWQENLGDKKLLKTKLELDRQVISKLTALKGGNAYAVVKSMMADAVSEGDPKALKMIASLVDKNGNLRDPKTAGAIYASTDAARLYKDGELISHRNDFGVDYNNPPDAYKTKEQKAATDLQENYDMLVKKYKEHRGHISFGGKDDTPDSGGTWGVEGGKRYNVVSEKDLNPDTKIATDVSNTILKNIEEAKVFSGVAADPTTIKDDPGAKALVSKFLSDYKANLGKKGSNTNFTLTAQASPEIQPGDKYLGTWRPAVVAATNYYTVSPNADWLKKQLGNAYNPANDYSFTVAIPKSKDQSVFSQQTNLSPAQMLMKHDGQTLTINKRGAGNLTINKGEGNSYYITGSINIYDSKTNSYVNEPVNPQVIEGALDADEAWAQANNYLNTFHALRENAVKQYLEYQKSHAYSGK